MQADRAYLAGMRPHHVGALSMSQDYLADPAASSPVLKELAQAIIRNQLFEIGLLDEVARNLDQPPLVLDLGFFTLRLQRQATEGLAQMQKFQRAPIPGPLALLAAAGSPVSLRDVQFAKAMIVHHQAALTMAQDYNANPDGRNRFLGLLNVDIITDQGQEIALMRQVIARFPGDAAAVPVNASMIHGMADMQHGGEHAGHEATAPAPEAAPAAAPPLAPWAPAARQQQHRH